MHQPDISLFLGTMQTHESHTQAPTLQQEAQEFIRMVVAGSDGSITSHVKNLRQDQLEPVLDAVRAELNQRQEQFNAVSKGIRVWIRKVLVPLLTGIDDAYHPPAGSDEYKIMTRLETIGLCVQTRLQTNLT